MKRYETNIMRGLFAILLFGLMGCGGSGGSAGGSGPKAVKLIGGAVQDNPLSLSGTVTTIGGTAGNNGTSDGIGAAASFRVPLDVTTDGTNLYVLDSSTIRKVVISTGAVSTLAGSADTFGSTDGTGASARFNFPTGITTDGINLYVSEMGNSLIRMVSIQTRAVTTLAGSLGVFGSTDGIGAAASFNGLVGITTDGTNLYVTDNFSHTIRKIAISTGAVTTFAGSAGDSGSSDGSGVSARFYKPWGITTDGKNLYVADTGNGLIRKIALSTGDVTTIAGTSGSFGWPDGTGSAAFFTAPTGITTDGTNLYVTDNTLSNSLTTNTIRKVVISTGVVTTLAGTGGTAGSSDGVGAAARFDNPAGIITDGTSLYVTDYLNCTIRMIH